jgi:hypothetical protein
MSPKASGTAAVKNDEHISLLGSDDVFGARPCDIVLFLFNCLLRPCSSSC